MKRSIITTLAFSVAGLSVLAACSDHADVNQAATNITASAAPPVAHSAPPTQSATGLPAARSGTVISNHIAGAYSYIETDIQGERFWLAASAIRLDPGDEIAWNDHAPMRNFTSKALNRTFDQILFVGQLFKPADVAAASAQHTGTVLEAKAAAGYSYLHVDEKGSKVWLAAPQMLISPGQTVHWEGGSTMRNFTSRALDQTFDQIIFVSAISKSPG